MSRECKDWLSSYIQYTSNSESPTSFHTWCGIALIAGALQRKVCLSWGFERIYPNLYIVLVGPSGSRKGLALGIAKTLLVNIPGVSVAPESSSGREAMIQAMKRASASFQDRTDGQIKFHCSITAFSEELSVFLGQKDVKYLSNLTDWYDSKDDWRYETIGRGMDALQGLCLNWMGATAPDWMQSMLPQEALGGGFTARVLFIVEEHKGKTISKHTLTKQEIELGEALGRDLERINQLSGAVEFTAAGEAAYIQWYEEQDTASRKGDPPIADPRFSSYCERRATHLRKIMISLCASRGDTLEIDVPDFTRGLQVLKLAEQKMHKAFGGLGKAKYSDSTEHVKDYLKAMGTSTRSLLMGKFHRDVDAPTLKVIEETLTQLGVLRVELLVGKNDKLYTWIGER